MFCENCGHKVEEDAAFCENCGQPLKRKPVEQGSELKEKSAEQRTGIKEQSAEQVSGVKKKNAEREFEVNERAVEQKPGINKAARKQDMTEKPGEPGTQGNSDKVMPGQIVEEAGTYNWMYEFSLWKNPAVFITVYKVLLISLAVPALLMFFLTLGDGAEEAFKVLFVIIGYGIVLMTALTIVAYIFVGILYGGRYYVLFKMDDKGINHIQLEKQYKKAQALGFLTALTGVSAGSLSAGGAGLLAASRQSLYTSFKKVKSIKICPGRNTIYLNESMARNQIYATKEDFQFVKEYILKNCPKNVRVK